MEIKKVVKNEIERELRNFLEKLFSEEDLLEEIERKSAFSFALIKTEEFIDKLKPRIDSKIEQEQDRIFRSMEEEAKEAMIDERKREIRKEALRRTLAALEDFESAISEEKHKLKNRRLQG